MTTAREMWDQQEAARQARLDREASVLPDDLLGYVPGDELVDLFPGTGVMGRVVENYQEAMAL